MTEPTATSQATTAGTAADPQQTETSGREVTASLWADARRQLVRNPVFLASALYILVVTSMAVWPRLWTSADPRACDVLRSRQAPSAEHWFGFNLLGCDYYAHAIYGARPSLSIAILATGGAVLLGGTIGMLAGYFGGWPDAILSRLTDIFLSLPFLLGALVLLAILKQRTVFTIALTLIILGWTTIARITRGSVLASKNLDYVQAAKALGASHRRLISRHILPNAIAPVVVYATILLGSFVAVEATLTFLGVGLQAPAASWGVMIQMHEPYFVRDPWLLIFPVVLLVGTVLSFILAGDALRDALDPKLR